MNAYISKTIKKRIGISYLDSVALYAAQTNYTNMPRPLESTQTAQNGGAHSFYETVPFSVLKKQPTHANKPLSGD